MWGKGVLNGYSSTRVSLWDSLVFGRLATTMGFATVRADTRVLMLVLVQATYASLTESTAQSLEQVLPRGCQY